MGSLVKSRLIYQDIQYLRHSQRSSLNQKQEYNNNLYMIASKEANMRQSSSEPLIYLPDNGISIYPDRIVQAVPSKNNSISALQTTVFSIPETDCMIKTVMFKNEIAFKIDEKYKKVVILKINSEKSELEFLVAKEAELISVQEILRRKLCEIGFQEKFKVIKQLGKGATAKVYLVQRISDGKPFAAKIISIKQASNKDYQTFINQTKIIKSLKNPHILEIQSLYISKKELICVIQYLEGGTLLDELKKDLLKSDIDKMKAIKDIALGLEHLRQKRIVHRDLKLQNIMVRLNKDKTKDYVIVDFGLACWIGEKQLLYEKCGTPGYIAPEVLKAPKGKIIVSHTSDIFSFGIIAHFIMLLKAVFPYNGNPKQLLAHNKKASFSLQSKSHFNLFPSELQILQKTLELDPLKRITSEQLIKIYIRNYEKQVLQEQARKNRTSSVQKQRQKFTLIKDTPESKEGSFKVTRINFSSSIQMVQKRVPSLDKNHFSNRIKTQQSQPKKDREGSVGKFFSKVWNKISHSSTQVFKKKQQPLARKKKMRDFIS